ncbi:MAG: EAL domain-containing protein [Gemmobacter sp.]|nr:EAL domain-containing protein [Gemmobacter sp.]
MSSREKTLLTLAGQIADHQETVAMPDGLTGLAGRQEFCANLAGTLPTLDQDALLCLIDIDQFRFLNSALGPSVGDVVLKRMSALLQAELAPGDLIGRTGDDEFTILLVGRSLQTARAKVAAMLEAMGRFRLVQLGRDFSLSACAGLAVVSSGDDGDSLLHVVASACGAAKDAGRGSMVLAGEAICLSSRFHREARILTGLQSAIAADRLRLFAQEIFSFDPLVGDVLEFELLVHMVDADGTEFPPSAIIPAAERHGFIRDLDRWVMKAALVDGAELLHRNPNINLSLNLSGPSIADPELWPYIEGLFRKCGVAGARIQFEITETSAITDMAVALAFVQAARAYGCKVALDDFGSGLSSFVYLRTFPVDCIKIDGAFVGKVTEPGSADHAIVKAIVSVARDLGLSVVAEHVDSTEVLATLRQMGIDKVQGFLISQPKPFRELIEKLNG